MKILLMSLILAVTTFGQNINKACQSNYIEIYNIVVNMGWKITSTVNGKHNGGSRHYVGKAVDVSVRNKTEFDIIVLDEVLKNAGYILIDERIRPKGQYWTAPHLHLSVRYCR